MKIAALSHLGDRLHEYRDERPRLCGVYLLVQNDEVIYVGQTADLDTRVTIHRSVYDFDRVFWIPVSAERLDEYEGALIRRLAPRHNRKHTVPRKTDAAIIEELALPEPDPADVAQMLIRKRESYDGMHCDARPADRGRHRKPGASPAALKITELRKAQGLSTLDVAKRMADVMRDGKRWDRCRVWRHESGTHRISTQEMVGYAQVLGISVESLRALEIA